MKTKLIYTAAVFAVVLGSAVTFRLVTGKCPIGCLVHSVSGKPETSN